VEHIVGRAVAGVAERLFSASCTYRLLLGRKKYSVGATPLGVSLASRVRKWSLPSPFRGAWIIASSQFRRIYLPVQLSRPVQVRPLFVAPADRNAAPVGNVEAPARLSS
jgi:hypothetical protein